MCGICGLVSKRGAIPDKTLIGEMMDRLYHRGPDGRGWFRDNNAALGHTRLSIIDLDGGKQPLCNEDESLWISFNGEIFNYIELREELVSLGHVFKTNSDTEVIIHAWESWGKDCFKRFNGQWAIAIWDRKKKNLILSRDRHGIRPLYYCESKYRFLFASEIKSIFADKTQERAFSPNGLQQTFTFWGPIAPSTVFRGIFELEPGHYAIYNEKKGLQSYPYWKIDFPYTKSSVKPNTEEDCIHEVRERLEYATKLRFERSDVPVGAYLSGGIDSSINASIVSRYAQEGLKTFSICFSDPQFDESSYQAEMVNKLGSDHSSFIVEPDEIGNVFPEIMMFAERPIHRTAPAPLFLLSKLVKESGYKVVVTGEGADETLGGYDIFREAYVRREIAKQGQNSYTNDLVAMLYPWMGDKFKRTPAFTRAFFSKNLAVNDLAISHRPRWDNFRLLLPMLSEEMKNYVLENDVIMPLLRKMETEEYNWTGLEKAQWLEYSTLLSGYILSAQGDRMLMANSIEGRFPFLDYEFVNYANRLNSEMKLNPKGLTEKYVLKEAFKRDIPNKILKRSKQPYQSPNGISFISSNDKLDWKNEALDKVLLDAACIFNSDTIEALFRKAKKNKKNLSYGDNFRIVSVLSTMLIYKQFIKDNDFLSLSNKDKVDEIHYDYCKL